MEPLFFRSIENASAIEHVYHRPDELIGFADLLMRWSSLSFYKVPFFTVMRRVGEDFGFYLHLYEAKSIAFSDALPEGVSEETRESPYEEDGSQKPRRKNAKPRKKTTAELEADCMYIYLRFQSPFYFRNRFEYLYDNFCRLYFLRSEVEAIEKAHPECRIISPLSPNEDSRYYDLYVTTENNIADVAHQTLIRMANCISAPVQHSSSFRNGLLNPDSGGWWTSRGGVLHEPGSEEAQNPSPLSLLPVLLKGNIWPDVPVTIPENPKKSRKTTLKDIWPKVAILKRLGIREQEKLAKIIYSLHPFLTDEEVGRLFPAKSGTRRSKGTDRDRGRILLGKKKTRKTAPSKAKTHT